MEPRKENLGFMLVGVARLMRRAFEQRFEAGPLTLVQARALMYLARNEGIRQVALAELLQVQPITLARLVDQLAAGGLVERRTDPLDRRAYRLFLAPGAGPQLEAIEAVVNEILFDALQGLSEADTATVLSALARMYDNLSPRD